MYPPTRRRALRQCFATTTVSALRTADRRTHREVLRIPLGVAMEIVRARRPHRVPVVLTREEVRRLIERLPPTERLIAGVLYGSGLRLLEALTLRVKDIDMARREITVRGGKGARDRRTVLPDSLSQPLQTHLSLVRDQHQRDRMRGSGRVMLPGAYAHKNPGAPPSIGAGSGSSLPCGLTSTPPRTSVAGTTFTPP